MAKSEIKPAAIIQKEPNQAPEVPKLVKDLGSLMYYRMHGSKVKFESLPEGEQYQWSMLASSALASIGKLDMKVVSITDPVETESKYKKNVEILQSIIDTFVRGVKTLRCPKCGSTADSRAALFPSQELAHRILDAG